MRNVIYEGVFFDADILKDVTRAVRENPLEKEIESPHLTTGFRPKETHEDFYGYPAMFYAVGYGNDGENEGLLVQLADANDEIRDLVDAIAVKHVTLAVSASGKPVNTAKIEFKKIKPFTLFGHFGAFIDGKVVTSRG